MCSCWCVFCKKKTAYERRICDLSSDVCSTVRLQTVALRRVGHGLRDGLEPVEIGIDLEAHPRTLDGQLHPARRPAALGREEAQVHVLDQLGTAPWRVRVCPYV